MMIKEFESLMASVQTIENGIEETRKTLDDLLSRSDKSFSITFKGNNYEFFPATTDDELEKMRKIRRRFIKSLLRRVVSINITHDNYGWDDILAFAAGVDPKDFQYEKISLDDLYKVADDNGGNVTSLPLNTDSVYVKMQDSRNDNENSKSS